MMTITELYPPQIELLKLTDDRLAYPNWIRDIYGTYFTNFEGQLYSLVYTENDGYCHLQRFEPVVPSPTLGETDGWNDSWKFSNPAELKWVMAYLSSYLAQHMVL